MIAITNQNIRKKHQINFSNTNYIQDKENIRKKEKEGLKELEPKKQKNLLAYEKKAQLKESHTKNYPHFFKQILGQNVGTKTFIIKKSNYR